MRSINNSLEGTISLFEICGFLSKSCDLSCSLREPVFLSEKHRLLNVPELFFGVPDDIRMSWSDAGIAFELISDQSSSSFTRLEIFIDPRDDKKRVRPSNFCSSFVFTMPEMSGSWILNSSFELHKDRLLPQMSLGAIFYNISETKTAVRCWIGEPVILGYYPSDMRSIGFSYSYVWGDYTSKPISFSAGVNPLNVSLWSSLKMLDQLSL